MKNNEQFEDYVAFDKYIRHTEKYEGGGLLYLWIFIILLAFHFFSCTPDNYVQITPGVQTDTGYVVMRHWQETYADEFETLNCIRKIEDDTTYWETGCFDNTATPQEGDSKDSTYQTYPWRLVRFVKAKVKLESCEGR